MPEIENTEKIDPFRHAVGMSIAGQSSYIESMEKDGQTQFVRSTAFPAKTQEPRSEYEALGFVFGDPVEGDDLFVNVTLPGGWKKEATDHDMWSKVVDADGKTRVMVFYKAAFYDRGAFARIEREHE